MKQENRIALSTGIRDGIPIALGYLAVSFSLGIAARNAGLTPFQGLLASLLCNASAGEYAGFTMIAAKATCLELALITLIANARYFLMSCAMSQRTAPNLKLRHRLGLAFGLTDELFGIALARPGFLNPFYTYGAFMVASPAWGLGTALGALAGSLMPARLVSACSVALYGMFLAVIIPPARKNKVIAGLIAVCFACSYAASCLPMLARVSEGTRTILLTVLLSAGAALLFPRREEGSA
ncbi:MAG: AzlC family ABC transporter permease [Clostridia bacterium]|nr:AzlC family ABC transporter permease [Clostridia bacterium]